MIYNFYNKQTEAACRLLVNEEKFDRVFYGKDRKDKFLTLAWNQGSDILITIDKISYVFKSGTILCLMVNQSFEFPENSDIIVWQFNKDFYCIESHDSEVGCVGFLFYGLSQSMFVSVEDKVRDKLTLLLRIFIEEFQDIDDIQEDMLRMLLKRLIILITRSAKKQFVADQLPEQKLNIIRQFNLLVEKNYKSEHSVKFYADQLNKSPKTLSNFFNLYNNGTPSEIIQQRIILEAKRLLLYTNKSAKEIAYELGFEEVAYFSSFFKRSTGASPVLFKKQSSDISTL
ncbi:helix-turn-helix domain-containing protein [Chryseobacterium paridis]|uniref:Helix-turn-helix domain-containing protein n=1 Tax=Chryseobacterium paridis TaxID=2800328 RepID=A0ABS1FW20_9FLAO|nr:AraC family transcriptional regulator [Chryseobacterium paridis]MBK1896633.1 helix-turn-helix domain-containing protein [Chryseobacterium paridis]